MTDAMRLLHIGDKIGMPFAAWPRTDRDLWERAFTSRSILDVAGSGAALAHNTKRRLATSYATWLRWLLDHHPDQLACQPAACATPPAMAAFVAPLEAKICLYSAAEYVRSLRRDLELIAGDTTGSGCIRWCSSWVAGQCGGVTSGRT